MIPVMPSNNPLSMREHLPWRPGTVPLMLAPMQGLTNRALRGLFVDWSRPDVVFTEFMRVRPGSRKGLSDVNVVEAASQGNGVPLVVQLIGRDPLALVAAAEAAQRAGAAHLNINMGCPYGRMTSNSGGGALLKEPAQLAHCLRLLRQATSGSFSVKLRSGYDDPRQIFSLLPVLEDSGTDFIILHPRTVVQKFSGRADHSLTAEVVEKTVLPVIANGDVASASAAKALMASTGAAGLMLGRGAIADPLLFQRVRGQAPAEPSPRQRAVEIHDYLKELRERYQKIFCGDTQILCKLKEVVSYIRDQEFADTVRALQRSKSLHKFDVLLNSLLQGGEGLR